ncbi:MAG: ABC-2 family transporter protein [Ktedonobacteraceae bacterium]
MNTMIAQQEKSFRQNIGYALRKYSTVFQVSIANNLAYMAEVVFRTIFLVVFVYVFLQLWTATFAAKGIHSLSGFRISDMVWYLATTETIALSLPQLTRLIDQEVRSGQLAYLLGRPCSYVFYHYAQYLGGRLVRLVINAAVAFIVAMLFVGPPPFSWTGLLAFPLVVFLAISIDFVVYFSIGLLAFWTEETTPFFLIVNRLALVLGGVLAPLEVLPQPIRGLAQVLPFSAVLYGPARTLVHFEVDHFIGLLLQQAITLAIGSLVLFVLYRIATRRVNINGG